MVFLHLVYKFPAWARTVHIFSNIGEGGSFILGVEHPSSLHRTPTKIKQNKTNLTVTVLLFVLASHFVPRLWYIKMAYQL